ncbi:MAG: hypothetical protein HY868_22015 [Chloroflexi bacterium]|nr:hypothetical protein [Chloroflexota bacterium]
MDSSIPYSQITGALRARRRGEGRESDIHAVGRIQKFRRETKMRGLRDVFSDTAKLPLEIEFLSDVHARVYIPTDGDAAELEADLMLEMGAYRSLGFGQCRLKRTKPALEFKPVEGRLAVRVPENSRVLELFQIQVKMPIFGYLFQPDAAHEGGEYVRALFEDSWVSAPLPFLKETQEV